MPYLLNLPKLIKIFLIIVLLAINISLIPSYGTGDVDTWTSVIEKISKTPTKNLFPGCLSYDCGVFYPGNYPPGHFLPLFVTTRIMSYFKLTPHYILKLAVFIFYLASLIAVVVLAKKLNHGSKKGLGYIDICLVFLGQISLIINAQGLGYTDFFYAPFLITSTFFLFKEKYYLSGLFYGFSFLIKWQPLILFPVVLIYLFRFKKHFLKKIFFNILGILTSLSLFIPLNRQIFRVILFSFKSGTLNDPVLSSALNFQWLAAAVYKLFFPEIFGVLSRENIQYINLEIQPGVPSLISTIPRIIFYLGLFLILNKYFDKGKKEDNSENREKFLTAGIMVILFYFFVSSGVHENHLFPAVLLALINFLLHPSSRSGLWLIMLDGIYFTNLFLFYGVSGHIERIALWGWDITLLAAFIFSFVFFPLIFVNLSRSLNSH